MPLSRDSIHSSASAEPTLLATRSGLTPMARRVDPNAPTMTPQAITHGGAHPPREEQPAPASIGRFTVIRELGRGGTGVVYAAYDEQLDRKVAVKLLHSETREDVARVRLMREAQAMARLSHPNIVGVHEVGTFGRQVYVAMEFVHGMTLHAWLKRRRRPFHEIVALFRQAGEGLAAAHDAGLVHRDFKPQNAMVGTDGRVRVLDFGLARADGSPDLFTNLERTADSRQHLHALDTSLTITGSLVGTPAFMAPEQFRGEKADARADQFALCVALYEALYHSRPFAGDSLPDLMHSVLKGEVRDPGGKLPRGLRSAILRGLQLRPEARHPTMHAMLAAIDRVVEPRRRGWLASAVLGAGVLAGVGGMVWRNNELREVCTDRGAAEVATVWSPGRANAIAAALHASDARADETWPLAAARLDSYAHSWQRAVVDACTAGEIRREQSQERYDLRRACLDDRLRALQSTLALFERPEPILAIRAPDIVAGLAPVDSCADPKELARQATASPDPEHARMITDLRAELARAEALRRATILDESRAALDAIAGRIPADHAPLQAELALIRGRVHATAGRHTEAHEALRTAYFTGLRADHEPLAITAATELIQLSSEGLSDFDAADRWVRHARALLAHGHAPALRADLAAAEGRLALHTGRYAEAGSQFVRAIDLYTEAGLSDTPAAAVVLRTLADASLSAGQLDDAAEQLRRALIVLRRDYSPGHAEFAAAMHTEGRLALAHDDVAGALERFERARHDLDGLVAVDNPVYLQLTCSAALAYIRNSELERATTLIREALGAVESSDKAARTVRLSPELFTLRHTLASLLAQQGQVPAAEAAARGLLAEAERAWGPDEPHLATALDTIAEILLVSGRPAEAKPLAARAHELATTGGDRVHAKLRYNSAFMLARVLVTTDARSRADTLARDAHTLALAVGDKLKVAEIDKWLAEQSAG